jgi:hypothetical protein
MEVFSGRLMKEGFRADMIMMIIEALNQALNTCDEVEITISTKGAEDAERPAHSVQAVGLS